MRALSAAELLNVWERGQTQPLAQRALALLTAACPETPPDQLAQLSIGRRDACLLTLREWAFGPQLVSLTACPGCGEHLELTFNVADIRVSSSSFQAEGSEGVEAISLSVADYEVRFHLPDSSDLAAIADGHDIAAARRRMLERCLVAVRQNGEETSADRLPAEVTEAVVERMAQADPQADVELSLTCPACGHIWQAVFDILSFFWSEISAWAYRILREVHALASAYGWREADILAMSPWRRQLYLEMLGR